MKTIKHFLVVLLAFVALVLSGGSAAQVKKMTFGSKGKVVLTKKIQAATKVKTTESSQERTGVKNVTPAAPVATIPATVPDLTFMVDDIFRGGPAPTCGL